MNTVIYGIDFMPLLKARTNFEKFRANLSDEQYKAGAIQAFEYTYELTWKMMRKVLIARGQEHNSPREVFRVAGIEKLIQNSEIWFEFLKARNITVHSYDEEDADAVIAVFDDFSRELTDFLARIGILA